MSWTPRASPLHRSHRQRHTVDASRSHLGARLRRHRHAGEVLHGLDQQVGQHRASPTWPTTSRTAQRPTPRTTDQSRASTSGRHGNFIDEHFDTGASRSFQIDQRRKAHWSAGVPDRHRLDTRRHDLRDAAQRRPAPAARSARTCSRHPCSVEPGQPTRATTSSTSTTTAIHDQRGVVDQRTKVYGTMWTPPPTQLRDSQAGTAYYWYVLACKAPAGAPRTPEVRRTRRPTHSTSARTRSPVSRSGARHVQPC